MSGGFWAGSVPPWASVVMILVAAAVFILGMVGGIDLEKRRARHEAAEAKAEAAADRFIGELHHDPDPDREARRAAMARRTHPVYRRRAEIVDGPKRTAAFLNPQAAREAWLAHEEQALDVASDDPHGHPDVLAVIHADLDRFIAEVVHGGQQ